MPLSLDQIKQKMTAEQHGFIKAIAKMRKTTEDSTILESYASGTLKFDDEPVELEVAVEDETVADVVEYNAPEPVVQNATADSDDDLPEIIQQLAAAEAARAKDQVLSVDRSASLDEQINVVKSQMEARDSAITIEQKDVKPSMDSSESKVVTIPVDEFAVLLAGLDLAVLEASDNEIGKEIALDQLITNVPTISIVCLHSAYEVKLRGLSVNDKAALRKTAGNGRELMRKLYEVVYNRIHSSTPSKPDFETWTKLTALPDVETLLFGIYSMTYTKENEFNIKCTKCGTDNKVKTSPNQLIHVYDKAAYSRVTDIWQNVRRFDDLKNRSAVGTKRRIMLPVSNMIYEIRIPSLHDELTQVNRFDETTTEKNSVSIQYSVYVESVLLPDREASVRQGKLVYYKETNRDRIVKIISEMTSDTDERTMNEEVEKMLETYSIKYQIPEFNCGGCSTPIGPLTMDIAQMLFSHLVGM
jgi:hypothetical protein